MPVAAGHPADPLWVAARKERSELPPLLDFSRELSETGRHIAIRGAPLRSPVTLEKALELHSSHA